MELYRGQPGGDEEAGGDGYADNKVMGDQCDGRRTCRTVNEGAEQLHLLTSRTVLL